MNIMHGKKTVLAADGNNVVEIRMKTNDTAEALARLLYLFGAEVRAEHLAYLPENIRGHILQDLADALNAHKKAQGPEEKAEARGAVRILQKILKRYRKPLDARPSLTYKGIE